MNNLTLEELIGLKLEISSRTLGSPLYGIVIWKTLPTVVKDAVLKYAYAAFANEYASATFLGLSINKFKEYMEKHQIPQYFQEMKEKIEKIYDRENEKL